MLKEIIVKFSSSLKQKNSKLLLYKLIKIFKQLLLKKQKYFLFMNIIKNKYSVSEANKKNPRQILIFFVTPHKNTKGAANNGKNDS